MELKGLKSEFYEKSRKEFEEIIKFALKNEQVVKNSNLLIKALKS